MHFDRLREDCSEGEEQQDYGVNQDGHALRCSRLGYLFDRSGEPQT